VERLALRLDAARTKQAGLTVGRNAFLLLTALMEFGATAPLIVTGIHKGTPYHDCSEAFVETMQGIFDSYTDGVTRIVAPFVHWTKREIWEFCKTNRVPLKLTYSCEAGGVKPCGHCLSCQDVQLLHAA
jgi:7-cyano-7-deazaguanine synthase